MVPLVLAITARRRASFPVAIRCIHRDELKIIGIRGTFRKEGEDLRRELREAAASAWPLVTTQYGPSRAMFRYLHTNQD